MDMIQAKFDVSEKKSRISEYALNFKLILTKI